MLVGPDTPGHPLDVGEPGPRVRKQTTECRTRSSFSVQIPDPAEILRAADLFVHPSHYEAFGLSVAGSSCQRPSRHRHVGRGADRTIWCTKKTPCSARLKHRSSLHDNLTGCCATRR